MSPSTVCVREGSQALVRVSLSPIVSRAPGRSRDGSEDTASEMHSIVSSCSACSAPARASECLTETTSHAIIDRFKPVDGNPERPARAWQRSDFRRNPFMISISCEQTVTTAIFASTMTSPSQPLQPRPSPRLPLALLSPEEEADACAMLESLCSEDIVLGQLQSGVSGLCDN